jgi:hypothetical protein
MGVSIKTWLKDSLIGLALFELAGGYAILNIKSAAAGYLYGDPLLTMDQSRLTFLGADQQT